MWLILGISVINLLDKFQISKTINADNFLDALKIFYVKISPLIIIAWSTRTAIVNVNAFQKYVWMENYRYNWLF